MHYENMEPWMVLVDHSLVRPPLVFVLGGVLEVPLESYGSRELIVQRVSMADFDHVLWQGGSRFAFCFHSC